AGAFSQRRRLARASGERNQEATMKTLLSIMMAGSLMLALGGSPAQAQSCEETRLIDRWYQSYLNRPADVVGLAAWTQKLRCAGPEAAQAGILASDEFYCQAGQSPEGFVASLYAHVLGRPAVGCEVGDWVRRFQHCGDRERL